MNDRKKKIEIFRNILEVGSVVRSWTGDKAIIEGIREVEFPAPYGRGRMYRMYHIMWYNGERGAGFTISELYDWFAVVNDRV